MMREYIKIKKPSSLPSYTHHLIELDDSLWKEWVNFHLLSFYKKYDKEELKELINIESKKSHSRIEDEIARYIRSYLKNDKQFCFQGFLAKGGVLNDEKVKGIYDVSILHSFWKNGTDEVCFDFECKNLDSTSDLVNKYVFYDKGKKNYDGGVYRYFNGKYAQNQNFGGMIGFILSGEIKSIKSSLFKKLNSKFDLSPEGDLKQIIENSIEENEFTFDSIHNRSSNDFTLHHFLLDFTFSS